MVLVPQAQDRGAAAPVRTSCRARICAPIWTPEQPPTSRWSARLPVTARHCCWRTGRGTSTAMDIAWVGLDRDDNDPGRLWSAIVAAVANCPSVSGSGRLHASGPGSPRTSRSSSPSSPTPLAGAAATDPADPRRRAGTGRPAARWTACAPSSGSSPRPSSSCWPAGLIHRCRCPGCGWPAGCGSCAPRSCPSHRSRRGAAGELGAAAVTAPGRGPARAHRGVGRRVAAGRSRYGGVCRPRARSSPSSPVTTARWPTTWSARSSRRAARRPAGLPARDQHL